MSRKAVVVDDATKREPRKVVVVRKGPPERSKTFVADVTTGVAGALLLILAILLVPLLPQDPPPIPQFEISFTETVEELPGLGSQTIEEGGTVAFTFDVPDAKVYRVEAAAEWMDDHASSDSDVFSIEVEDPNGNILLGPRTFPTPAPQVEGQIFAPTYSATPAGAVLAMDVAKKPATVVVSGESSDTTVADIEATEFPKYLTNATGQWTIRVTLVEAGDCPDPTVDANRALACQAEGSQDTSNPFQVTLVSLYRYEPSAQALT